jgi:hypothetical protein
MNIPSKNSGKIRYVLYETGLTTIIELLGLCTNLIRLNYGEGSDLQDVIMKCTRKAIGEIDVI